MAGEKEKISSAKMRELAKNLNNPDLLDVAMDKIDPGKRSRIDKALGDIRSRYFIGDGRDVRIPAHIKDEELSSALEILNAAHNLSQDLFNNPDKYAKADMVEDGKMVPSEASLIIVEEAGGELRNAAGEYRLVIEEEIYNRANKRTGNTEKKAEKTKDAEGTKPAEAMPPGEPPKEPPKPPEDAPDGLVDGKFVNGDEYLKKVALDPRFSKDWNRLAEAIPTLTNIQRIEIPKTYPAFRKGVNLNRDAVIVEVGSDYQAAESLVDSLSSFAKYELKETTGEIGKKKDYITDTLVPKLTDLRDTLRVIKNKQENIKFDGIVRQWKGSVDGLNREEFTTVLIEIKAIEANDKARYKQISDYDNSKKKLESASQSLGAGGPSPINSAMDNLRTLGVSGDRYKSEREEINKIYIEGAKNALALLEGNAYEFWRTVRMDEVFTTISQLEKETPKSTLDFKTNYDRRITEIGKLRSQKSSVTAEIVAISPTSSTKAGTEYDRRLAVVAKNATEVARKQFEYWERNDMLPSKLPLKPLHDVRTSAESLVTASGVTETDLSDREGELLRQSATFRTELAKLFPNFISDVKLKADFDEYIARQDAETLRVRNLLLAKKKEIADAVVRGKLERATKTINAITDPKFDEIAAETYVQGGEKGYKALLLLKKQLETDLHDTPAGQLASLNYESAEKKIDRLINAVELKELGTVANFGKLIDEAMAASVDRALFFNDKSRDESGIPARTKEILKRIKDIYNNGPEPTTVAERREYRFQRTRLWAWAMSVHMDPGNGIPAGNNRDDKVIDLMLGAELGATLSRKDFLDGIIENPKYGADSVKMLEYAVAIVAKRTPPDPETGPDTNPYGYDNLTGAASGATALLKNHLGTLFLEQKDASGNIVKTGLPKEVFDTVFNLYFDFDLLSVSLARRLKYTQTRGHGNYDKDPNRLTHPLHFMVNTLGRGGNTESRNHILLALMDGTPTDVADDPVHGWKYVNDYIGAGKEIKYGICAQSELIKLFFAARFDTTGDAVNGLDPIESAFSVNPNDPLKLKDWDESVFPDNLRFLTEGLDKIPDNPEMYKKAKIGWGIILDTVLADIPPFSDSMKIIGDGGYYKKITEAIGTAKLVKGAHNRALPLLTRFHIGQLGFSYTERDARKRGKLTRDLANMLSTATRLKGLDGFDDLIKYLENGSPETHSVWSEQKVAKILIPPTTDYRRKERVRYMKEYFRMKLRRNNVPTRPGGIFKEFVGNPDRDAELYWNTVNAVVDKNKGFIMPEPFSPQEAVTKAS